MYITAEATSTFYELGNFIARVESSDGFFTIEEIEIKRLDSEKGFDEEKSKYKIYDMNAMITISATLMKE